MYFMSDMFSLVTTLDAGDKDIKRLVEETETN